MESNNILDSQLVENKQTLSKKNTKMIIYVTMALMFVNVIFNYLSPLVPNSNVVHLDGTKASLSEIKRAGYSAILLTIPVFSFIIALILSLIPFKKLSYKKKYWRFALVTMMVFNLYMLSRYIFNFFM
jgi:hypothetical protein